MTGAANCGERSTPSGTQCVPSMFVSQINCIVSPLCLLLTGWTNDKFSLSQEALTVNVSCLFTSSSPRNNAKRLTINYCHYTLSLVPITCKLTVHTETHTASERMVTVARLWDWWHRHTVSDGHLQLCSISPPEAGGGHKCMKTSLQGWVRDVCGERLACSTAGDEWNN